MVERFSLAKPYRFHLRINNLTIQLFRNFKPAFPALLPGLKTIEIHAAA